MQNRGRPQTQSGYYRSGKKGNELIQNGVGGGVNVVAKRNSVYCSSKVKSGATMKTLDEAFLR